MSDQSEEAGADAEGEALAAAYDRGLKAEKAGDVDAAEAAYREMLAIDPQDIAGVSVRLASLGRGETPEKAPDAYVATLFDQHAEVFDHILVEQLGYDAPLQLRDFVNAHGAAGGPTRFERMLDLGCGTGLCGEAFEDVAAHRVGVDISEEMIAIADEKEVYQELFVGEGVAFLESDAARDAPFDLIAATDMLPYLGDLRPFFDGAAERLAPNGLFGFSSETLSEEDFAGAGYKVSPKHRFAHRKTYVEATLRAAKLQMRDARDIVVRYDEGQPIRGHLFLAGRLYV